MGPIGVQIEIDGRDDGSNFRRDGGDARVLSARCPELAAALQSEGLTLAGGGVFDSSAAARQQRATGPRGAAQGGSTRATTARRPSAGQRRCAPRRARSTSTPETAAPGAVSDAGARIGRSPARVNMHVAFARSRCRSFRDAQAFPRLSPDAGPVRFDGGFCNTRITRRQSPDGAAARCQTRAALMSSLPRHPHRSRWRAAGAAKGQEEADHHHRRGGSAARRARRRCGPST